MLHLILFLFFGAICVAGAINLLVQSHPINSALSLIAVMAALAAEYLLLGAEFVAAVQVIVYAGAIMVLFVITIMLLNAGEEERTQRQPHCPPDRRSWRGDRRSSRCLDAALRRQQARSVWHRRAARRSPGDRPACCFMISAAL